jgi:hypothetical protein
MFLKAEADRAPVFPPHGSSLRVVQSMKGLNDIPETHPIDVLRKHALNDHNMRPSDAVR